VLSMHYWLFSDVQSKLVDAGKDIPEIGRE
jgi:hypothetical protein